MLPDDRDERPRPDPRAGGRGRIEIIDRAAGGIDAVECIARGAVGALRDRLIELPIRDARERAALIDDAGERIRERRVLDAVEHDGADATWPEYGSPRASAEIRRASRSTCELDAPPEPPELLELPPPADSPMAASVWSPALPSTVRPFFCWKARTARSVPLP